MIDFDKLKASCRQHEGTGPIKHGNFMAYNDSLGNPTIGYGHLLANGISHAATEQILDDDTNTAAAGVAAYPWWQASVANGPEPRARALVELFFELGVVRFNGFRNALAACAQGDWPTAAQQFLESKWATQVGKRAVDMCRAIGTGEDY